MTGVQTCALPILFDWLGIRRNEPKAAAAAALIERAVEQVVAAGRELTGDLGGSASTAQMGDAVARAIATV